MCRGFSSERGGNFDNSRLNNGNSGQYSNNGRFNNLNMKKLIYFLILILLVVACQKRQFPSSTRYVPVGVGTVANDGTGDNLRTAFQKVNAGFVDVYDSLGNIYTEAQTDVVARDSAAAVYYDSITVLKSAALPAASYFWELTDTAYVPGEVVTYNQLQAGLASVGGGTGSFYQRRR